MICPHCNKIIAEGSTGCPFCKAQFFAPPQEPVQAGAEVQRTLSGFLRFLVVLWKHILFIFCIIAAILQALAGLKQIFSIAQSDISWQVLKPAFYYFFLTVFYLFLGIIYRKLAVKIEKKDIGFLHFWQISRKCPFVLHKNSLVPKRIKIIKLLFSALPRARHE